MPPDWKKAEHLLTDASVETIKLFATENDKIECCHFAFDSEPCYGYVFLCFDTTANSLVSSKASESRLVERRLQMLAEEDSWRNANYFLNTPELVPFGDNTGDFEFASYREIKFPEWQVYAEDPDYPSKQENEDDYLEGNFRILVWRVVERLVRDNAFDCLKKSAPFLVSYGLHDQEQRIIRILNWPNS